MTLSNAKDDFASVVSLTTGHAVNAVLESVCSNGAFSGGDLPEHAIAEHPTVHQQARTSCQWLAERPNSKSHCPPTSQDELPMAS